MPNTRLYGFRYIGPLNGGNPVEPLRFRVAAAYALALNVGDPVELLATGYVQLAAAATLGTVGVITGIGPVWNPATGRMEIMNRHPIIAGGPAYVYGEIGGVCTETTVLVVPAAGNLFECCGGTILAAATRAGYLATIGNNVPHMLTVAGNLNWPELNNAAPPGAGASQWRIMDLARTLYVDWAALYVPMIVSGNQVALPPAAPLAGI